MRILNDMATQMRQGMLLDAVQISLPMYNMWWTSVRSDCLNLSHLSTVHQTPDELDTFTSLKNCLKFSFPEMINVYINNICKNNVIVKSFPMKTAKYEICCHDPAIHLKFIFKTPMVGLNC